MASLYDTARMLEVPYQQEELAPPTELVAVPLLSTGLQTGQLLCRKRERVAHCVQEMTNDRRDPKIYLGQLGNPALRVWWSDWKEVVQVVHSVNDTFPSDCPQQGVSHHYKELRCRVWAERTRPHSL